MDYLKHNAIESSLSWDHWYQVANPNQQTDKPSQRTEYMIAVSYSTDFKPMKIFPNYKYECSVEFNYKKTVHRNSRLYVIILYRVTYATNKSSFLDAYAFLLLALSLSNSLCQVYLAE